MEYRVLIIEDEPQIREVVGEYFINAGYKVRTEENGVSGLAAFAEWRPHLLILDIMMPGISGFDVLREVRLISKVPVIILTAKHKEDDKLDGFDLGADDYVTKPFSPKELVKRAEAVIRRVYTPQSENGLIVCGGFALDTAKQILYKNNNAIEITSNEFLLLKVFLSNEKMLLSRSKLIEKAFGYTYDGFDRNIDTYIKNIRKKIEKNSKKPVHLKTKYGAGYIFEG